MFTLGSLKATEKTHKQIIATHNLITQIHTCEPLRVLIYAPRGVSFNKNEIILYILGSLCFLVQSYHLYFKF